MQNQNRPGINADKFSRLQPSGTYITGYSNSKKLVLRTIFKTDANDAP
jgi:hypothetical protein